ncbi:universal stress protein [Xanthovirga aplysinae]|uniref:universal stress protein n=1 Tax=Xanthovirga aplysinae TaxID=2529853 RepID=UPI0012BCECE0|nr:universal stress protein [Xanthovirga aplysinae]MTI31212.1 universal stress protein [Xanthovirga aplysinae]
MNKILCPVDLEPPSKNAVCYAAHLAQKTGATLFLLHVEPEISTEGVNDEIEKQKLFDLRQKMADFCHQIQTNFEINCEYIIKPSYFEETIITIANEQGFDLIVMGTEGISDFEDFVFGTFTLKVVKHSKPPVLVVPAEWHNYTPEKFIYASDYDEYDPIFIRKVVDLAIVLHAKVIYLHISKHGETFGDELFEVSSEEIKEELGAKSEYVQFEHMYDEGGTVKALKRYLQKFESGVVVVLKKERSVIGNLFHRSLTKKLTLAAKMPLLVFHRYRTKQFPKK